MHLARPLPLPSGLTLPNRIAKASTSERLADPEGGPSPGLIRLYERWGRGGAGLLLTGNVVVDRGGLEAPGNVVVTDERHLAALTEWAQRAQAGGARLVMQISHAGRQSPRSVTRTPVSASDVGMKGTMGVMARPRALEDGEIEAIVERFATTAAVARAAGFAGVQIHAAHGYLISQFLSPRTNQRTDRWGGSLDHRMRFLLAIVRATRATGIAVMVKLNSADFQRGGFDEEESATVVEALEAEGIDLLEVSGGNYESTAMFGRTSTREREAYFLEYVERIRARTRLPLMLTGGFRTAAAMEAALGRAGAGTATKETGAPKASPAIRGAVDVIGMARPLILEPDLPARLLDGRATEAAHDQIRARGRLLDDLVQATWYARQLRRMARGEDPDPAQGRWTSLLVEAPRAYL